MSAELVENAKVFDEELHEAIACPIWRGFRVVECMHQRVYVDGFLSRVENDEVRRFDRERLALRQLRGKQRLAAALAAAEEASVAGHATHHNHATPQDHDPEPVTRRTQRRRLVRVPRDPDHRLPRRRVASRRRSVRCVDHAVVVVREPDRVARRAEQHRTGARLRGRHPVREPLPVQRRRVDADRQRRFVRVRSGELDRGRHRDEQAAPGAHLSRRRSDRHRLAELFEPACGERVRVVHGDVLDRAADATREVGRRVRHVRRWWRMRGRVGRSDGVGEVAWDLDPDRAAARDDRRNEVRHLPSGRLRPGAATQADVERHRRSPRRMAVPRRSRDHLDVVDGADRAARLRGPVDVQQAGAVHVELVHGQRGVEIGGGCMASRLTAQDRLYRAVSEAEWQTSVVDTLRTYGWRTYHTYNSRRSDPGFPDIVAVHPRGDRLVAELKRETEHPTPEQQAWLDDFAASGVDAYVWRPSDMDAVIERAARPRTRQ